MMTIMNREVCLPGDLRRSPLTAESPVMAPPERNGFLKRCIVASGQRCLKWLPCWRCWRRTGRWILAGDGRVLSQAAPEVVPSFYIIHIHSKCCVLALRDQGKTHLPTSRSRLARTERQGRFKSQQHAITHPLLARWEIGEPKFGRKDEFVVCPLLTYILLLCTLLSCLDLPLKSRRLSLHFRNSSITVKTAGPWASLSNYNGSSGTFNSVAQV